MNIDLNILDELISSQGLKDLYTEDRILNAGSTGSLFKRSLDKSRAGTSGNEQELKDKKYYRDRTRINDRIINHLFLLDYKNHSFFSDFASKYYEACRLYLAAIILRNRQLVKEYKVVAHRGMALSIKGEFINLALLFSQSLFRFYSIIEPNKKKMIHFGSQISLFKEALDSEMLMNRYYCELSFRAVSSGESLSVDSKKICLQAESLMERHKNEKMSFSFWFDGFQILCFRKILGAEYEEAIEICENAKEFLKNRPFNSPTIEAIFSNDIIYCLECLDKLIDAKKAIEKNIELYKVDSYNWFSQSQVYYRILAKLDYYDLLLKLTSEVIGRKRLSAYKIHHQSWLIKEAYVHFLIRMNKIDEEVQKKYPLRPFRLNRFLNEVPLFSKDKRGMNIPILIVQVLFLIEQGKTDQVIDRLDALNQYSYRYLRNDETYRSNCFIKMLQKIPGAAFHPLRTQKHTEILRRKLSSKKMTITDQSHEVEIIPYEALWEMVIELLGKLKKK